MTSVGISMLVGVAASPGVAVGPVARMGGDVAECPPADPAPSDVPAEASRLAAALMETAADLDRRSAAAPEAAAEILAAAALMAADPGLAAEADRLVAGGLPAARAVWDAADTYREQFLAAGGYFAERVADLDDVRNRVVARLRGLPMPGLPDPGYPFVLVAGDLAPADTATLRPANVLAIVTEQGGPTSHTAILAGAMGIPAVVACPGVLELPDGWPVAVDGDAGTVVLRPDAGAADAAAKAAAARSRRVPKPVRGSRTKDGHEVELLGNVGDTAGMRAAVAAGAQGAGLFRTELLFLDRSTAPGAEEQEAAYRAVFKAAGGRKVVFRTLDAGADKPLPFLRMEAEPNPALGVRGLRAGLLRPEALATQLDAVAAAAGATGANVWVMAPMVSTAEEAADFAAGIMVEVPAVVLSARSCLSAVDFASIGTNDLTQYVMAADRQLAPLARLSSPWQPAVLEAVALTAAVGLELDTPVGVCGEAAADPALAVVLIGLGITSLSMTPRALSDVAAAIGSVDLPTAQRLARLALDSGSADAARESVRAALPVPREIGR